MDERKHIPQDPTVEHVVERPDLPAMEQIDAAEAPVVADMTASSELFREGVAVQADMGTPRRGVDKPVVGRSAPPQQPLQTATTGAAGGESYVRLRVRVQDGKSSIVDAETVRSPLVTAPQTGGAYAYEVTLDGRSVAGDALGDLGVWRSYPDPKAPERGHHTTKLESYEFNVRIPTDRLPARALERVEIALLRVTDTARPLVFSGTPLVERHPVEVREISRISGRRMAEALADHVNPPAR